MGRGSRSLGGDQSQWFPFFVWCISRSPGLVGILDRRSIIVLRARWCGLILSDITAPSRRAGPVIAALVVDEEAHHQPGNRLARLLRQLLPFERRGRVFRLAERKDLTA